MIKAIHIYLLAALLLTYVVLLPFSLHFNDAVSNVIDPLFYSWNLHYNEKVFRLHGNDAFDTNIFYPLTNTIAYSDTLWAQSVIANPIIWLTHNPVLAENILVLLSFPLSALSMYLLSYYFTKNNIASYISGVFFAFSYPRLSQIGHLPMISSQWLPLYLLYLFKFLESGKRKDFLYVCFWYIISTASSIYFGVFLIPVTAIILAVDSVKNTLQHTLKHYIQLAYSAIPVLLPFVVILAIILSPYIRLKVENPDIKRSIDDVTFLRANLIDYVSVLPTSILNKLLPTNTNEHVLFPTLTLLLLASIGTLTAYKRHRHGITVLLLIILASFILSLGNEQSFTIGSFSTGVIKLPYYYLYRIFPLLQVVRVPARFSIFIMLSLSVLAAFGLDKILKNRTYKWIAGIFLCTYIFEIWQTNTPFVTVPLEYTIPKVYSWIKEQPEPMILAELPVSLFYHGNSMEDQLYKPYTALTQADTYALETYRVYFSEFHKKRLINGYSGYFPASYNTLTKALEEFPSESSIKALQDIGVTHAVVHLGQYEYTKRDRLINELSLTPLLNLEYSIEGDRIYIIHKKEK